LISPEGIRLRGSANAPQVVGEGPAQGTGAKGLGTQRKSEAKLRISAIIVGLNEAHLLDDCLTGIDFCDEIIYVDLGSEDGSIEIAERHRADVRHHARVPFGEYIVAELQRETRNEWILFLDPDEYLDRSLVQELKRGFGRVQQSKTVGVVSGRCQFYFKGKALIGTPWGGTRPRRFLAHRDRFVFTAEVHRGRTLRDGFDETLLVGEGIIHHFWADSWRQLIAKHLRYLKAEGESRFRRGDRISLGGVFASVPPLISQTYRRYWDRRDGLQGALLSFLWVSYKTLSLLNLWRFQTHQQRAKKKRSLD